MMMIIVLENNFPKSLKVYFFCGLGTKQREMTSDQELPPWGVSPRRAEGQLLAPSRLVSCLVIFFLLAPNLFSYQ